MHMARFELAASDFERARRLAPDDVYNLLYFYLASARTKADAQAHLEREVSQLELGEWPGPLFEMMLGNLSPDEVWARASSSVAPGPTEKRCVAAYITGEMLELKGQNDKAAERYRTARKICPRDLIGYSAARYGLERVGN